MNVLKIFATIIVFLVIVGCSGNDEAKEDPASYFDFAEDVEISGGNITVVISEDMDIGTSVIRTLEGTYSFITKYLDEPERLQRVTVAVIQGEEEAIRYTLLTSRLMEDIEAEESRYTLIASQVEDIEAEEYEGISKEQLVIGASEFTTESREVAEALADIGVFSQDTVDFLFPEE